MRVRHLVVLALAVPVVGMLARPALAEGAAVSEVPFTSTAPGEVIVPVFIGGTGPYRFLLDTGSSHTAIGHALAAALGEKPVAKTPVATPAGTVMCAVVALADLTIGSTRVEGILATELPAAADAILGSGIAGIVGQDFLSTVNYTLDYRGARLVLGDDDRAQGVRLALQAADGHLVVVLPQEKGCRCPVRFVPDSGASGLVLFERPDGTRVPTGRGAGAFRVDTLGGEGTASGVVVKQLQVGASTLRNQAAAMLASSGDDAGQDDGLLPLHLFASVTFNNRDGYMLVQAR